MDFVIFKNPKAAKCDVEIAKLMCAHANRYGFKGSLTHEEIELVEHVINAESTRDGAK